ncbi:hypothetical protein [Mesobacillus subterraneus]|nr:hypothetical protein [Mesobacillus subterraneus]
MSEDDMTSDKITRGCRENVRRWYDFGQIHMMKPRKCPKVA